MIPRELADLCERAPGFDAGTLKLLADTIRTQADEIDRLKAEGTKLANQSFLTIKSWRDMVDGLTAEIDALKAAAIVQGSLKLDQAAKVALEREAVKAAWKAISGDRGWLSNLRAHDSRCRALFNTRDPKCTCGADDFRRLMEE